MRIVFPTENEDFPQDIGLAFERADCYSQKVARGLPGSRESRLQTGVAYATLEKL